MKLQPPAKTDEAKDPRFSPPAVSLPKGGGAIKGIGEKFAANPVTGTGSLTIPLPLSPGRSGFTPALTLSYDSGAGNGPYGFGWSVGYPSITRRTDRGLPRYLDNQESDVFILSGAEDLVPILNPDGSRFEQQRNGFRITRYRPRIEGLFARIERWTKLKDPSDTFWRAISRDNVTTFYGKTPASRITDPADPTRIFTWLLCESFDDKGNAAVYEYIAEDGRNVDTSLASEFNRTEASRSANRYLKKVKYANRTSRLIQGDLAQAEWLFELVMDYGDHEGDIPSIDPTTSWPVRPDPFSTCRAGFEVRTYRRCQRVLMFHRFEELGPNPKLVRSLELDYDDFAYAQGFDTRAELEHLGSTRIGSLLRRATVTGYADNGFRKSMPPLELTYSRPQISEEVRTLDHASYENLPGGVDGVRNQWLDLNSEGISGVLAEQGGAWWYKPNLGEGQLGPQQLVAQQPSIAVETRVQFLDLAGDGQLDLVQLNRPDAGFFERDEENGWSQFTPFASQPNIEWDNPNLRLVDLTGDGHADVLITEDDIICWHPSLAEEGFGPRESLKMASDESLGPKLVFHDTTDTIFLADMSGDGLSDLVRVRNGEVCYWPNLGYGRFGGKVTMDNAPVLDAPELFEPRRIRLADIDGSGVVDIIYLAADGVRLYFNRSGNSWTAPRKLNSFPPIDSVASVSVTDLLGNGTACLVWSTPLPSESLAPLHYVDLMGNQKPHLLVGVENSLGARTRIEYTTSTRFYLEDQLAGRPWITRLPFPVHVVERTETFDDISRNRFVTRFAYHHGYFDGVEREFRGFGMVEQFDTEEFAALNADQQLSPATNIDASSHVPPVLRRTWFHTGVYIDCDRVSNFFAGLLDEKDIGEYYREPGLNDEQARRLLLDDTVLPPGLTPDEEREACRALKGAMLRQEVYALDGTEKQPHPYSVTEQNFTIRLLQRQGENHHAVFFSHPRESIRYHYERNPIDPRIAHSLTLEVDDFGNVLKSASVAYGRRQPDQALEARDQQKQGELHVTYAENRVTNFVETGDEYRTPLSCESRSYEVTGLTLPSGSSRFALDELLNAGSGAAEIAYEQSPTSGVLQKRLIEHVRTYYRRDNLEGPLPLGVLESLAIPFESYRLAFTPNLVTQVYGTRVTDLMLLDDGRYVHSENDNQSWIPSGRVFLSPSANDDAAVELAKGRQHFFLPRRYRDPFGENTFVEYDKDSHDVAYDLLLVSTRDALDNEVRAVNDYRVLQPQLTFDPNGNRSQVAFDALGLVAGAAVLGKTTESLGDSLADFITNLTPQQIDDFFGADDPHAVARTLLGNASTRIVYDIDHFRRSRDNNPTDPAQWAPAFAATIARETHISDLQPGQQSKVQISFGYSDGFGREIQKKVQAEKGPVPERDANGRVIVALDGQPEMTPTSASPRWVGSGWIVFNNKGKPVRQFEPFFTDTHRFELDVRIGVSSVVFYDPAERAIATLHANHTWGKVIFDPWRQESWDVNDTTLILNPKQDTDVGDFFKRLPGSEFLPTWFSQRQAGALGPEEQAAAEKTAIHAGTPSVGHADSLGRTVLTIAHNRFKRSDMPPVNPPTEEFYATRGVFDIEGNERELIDAKDRVVMRYDYDMLGNRIHQASMEAGERWVLSDIAGKPIYAWDSRDHQVRTEYDPLRRPVASFVKGADPQDSAREIQFEKVIYGDAPDNGLTDTQKRQLNLRGNIYKHHDTAGMAINLGQDPATNEDEAFDFKGNLLRSTRQLTEDYRNTPNWSQSPLPALEPEIFSTSTRYDAFNRPTEQVAPDGSRIRHTFNEANLLDRIEANLRGEPTVTIFVNHIDYDSKGRRTLIEYGNGVKTTYDYDRLTLRLTRLFTRRNPALFPDDCPQPPPVGSPGCSVQNLHYTYDPAGNITRIRDDAQQTIYFRNRRVEPSNEYTYDAVYRLIEATGREHLGQSGQPDAPDPFDTFRTKLDHPSDGNAMGTYIERYLYDGVGNFLNLQHRGSDSAHPGWTRSYNYNEPSQIAPGNQNNRLSSTVIDGITEVCRYDGSAGLHGDVTAMSHLPLMQWDFQDQLHATARQIVNGGTPATTWYVYDAGGQRVRKVTDRQSSTQQTTRATERTYLGGFELYREYSADGAAVTFERQTLHVMDDRQRIALIETKTKDTSQPSTPNVQPLIRNQFSNHLGSASLELDDRTQIISYEEYYPYGSTSYQAVNSQTQASKRYRYTGMERDDESGLAYHSARYYLPWLGRWASADPLGIQDDLNSYAYVHGRPLTLSDSSGTDGKAPLPPAENWNDGYDFGEYIPPTQPFESAVATPEPGCVKGELGPRGEMIRAKGENRAPGTKYTKPYAIDAAAKGKYDAAELFEHYMCPTCHVIGQVGHVPYDYEFSLKGYVKAYQDNYKEGAKLLALAAFEGAMLLKVPRLFALYSSYEAGVNVVEASTGRTSGAHLFDLAQATVTHKLDSGRLMSTPERGGAAVSAVLAAIPAVRRLIDRSYGYYGYLLLDDEFQPIKAGISSQRFSQRFAGYGRATGDWAAEARDRVFWGVVATRKTSRYQAHLWETEMNFRNRDNPLWINRRLNTTAEMKGGRDFYGVAGSEPIGIMPGRLHFAPWRR
ncbi:MAG TPA: SpvB/TcaC N-terminal domain-containing protein [Acidobacteriota bacterium]|jgi:RHS repeat-associated protein